MSVFTTSYPHQHMNDLLTALVKSVNPIVAVEIGVQQGSSAIAIARGLEPTSSLDCFDTFEKHYPLPPYANTYASMAMVEKNVQEAMEEDKTVTCCFSCNKASGVEAGDIFAGRDCDFVHIDIVNHYDNVKPILKKFVECTRKMIVLEGGIVNRWMNDFEFLPFVPMLWEDWVSKQWNYIVIPFDDHYAMTVMTPKLG